MRGADPHRRPRLLPAGDRALHRALPDARRLRAGPDDTRRRSRRSTASRPTRYPELAAIVGETSDNLPGVPGVGPGLRRQWINEYDGLDNVITHADKITGKKGEALREHLGDVIRNRRLNALVRDLDLEAGPGRPRGASRGTGRPVHTLFDSPGVPGAARPAARVVGRAGRDDRRLRVRRSTRRARRRRGGRLAGRPRRRAATRTGVTVHGALGRRHRRGPRLALAARRRPGGLGRRRPRSRPRTTRR